MPRLHCSLPLASGGQIDLPAGPARHAQVLRLQPGDALRLFNGEGGEFDAVITRMGRSQVQVEVGRHHALELEAQRTVHLVAGITANERMDWLIEKATELGATRFTPLLAARSVLRLSGERADKKRAHWQAVAVAACEQCGRNRVPLVDGTQTLAEVLARHPEGDATAVAPGGSKGWVRLVLSLHPSARPLADVAPGDGPVQLLSGPEGGLTPQEEQAALAAGFEPVTLGPRVLRAETAPLAALATLLLR